MKIRILSSSILAAPFRTDLGNRIAISIVIFVIAFTYRFSISLTDQSILFYYALGGGGDYDQFIRAAICAIQSFCPAVLGQNFLIESTVLGAFYRLFGFAGGLQAYLYLMIAISSFVACLPYLILSRKNWATLGGIIGSFFLSTSDFLSQVALNFPPDNGSVFTFSIFFIVYLVTIQIASIRWVLVFTLIGIIDGLNKALFLINNIFVFLLFIPVFFLEKIKGKVKEIFRRKGLKILIISILPLFIFLSIYVLWEVFVFFKFSAHYFLGGLIFGGAKEYAGYTALDENSLSRGVMLQAFYFLISSVIMVKRLILHANLSVTFLFPIFLALLLVSLKKLQWGKIVIYILLLSFIVLSLVAIENNYLNIHKVFAGEYIDPIWNKEIYSAILLLSSIIILFFMNMKPSVIKFALPILPYLLMLIIFTEKSPIARFHVHVVVWTIILLSLIVDWLMDNSLRRRNIKILVSLSALVIFSYLYLFPKLTFMSKNLNSGLSASRAEGKYLRWVNSEIPQNSIILAGGTSNLITVSTNISRPIIYSTFWTRAILITPNEIPGVKPQDFGITGVWFRYKLPMRFKPMGKSDFSIINELKNENNFKKNRYIILESDVSIWRKRIGGVDDALFFNKSRTVNSLYTGDYTLKTHKFNSALKKGIYELIRIASKP